MRHVEAAGLRVSATGLGTWQFGSREWGYGKEYAEGTAVEILDRALDLGVDLVDTAELYAFGTSERIVGRVLARRREEAVVATKILPVLPVGPVVRNRVRASARRLGVETIDLYQVHWPNPVVRDGPAMRALRELQDEGAVRHVGVSNYSLARWRAAERALGRPVVSNQVRYSLVDRGPDRDLVPYAAASDRLVIAYSPLAQGFLSARYGAGNTPGGMRATSARFLPENLERGAELLDALREVARAHGATPAQVALAWVLRRPNVVAIPGASSVEQLVRNAEAADLALTDDESERLTGASDRFDPVRGLAAATRVVRARLRR